MLTLGIPLLFFFVKIEPHEVRIGVMNLRMTNIIRLFTFLHYAVNYALELNIRFCSRFRFFSRGSRENLIIPFDRDKDRNKASNVNVSVFSSRFLFKKGMVGVDQPLPSFY